MLVIERTLARTCHSLKSMVLCGTVCERIWNPWVLSVMYCTVVAYRSVSLYLSLVISFSALDQFTKVTALGFSFRSLTILDNFYKRSHVIIITCFVLFKCLDFLRLMLLLYDNCCSFTQKKKHLFYLVKILSC